MGAIRFGPAGDSFRVDVDFDAGFLTGGLAVKLPRLSNASRSKDRERDELSDPERLPELRLLKLGSITVGSSMPDGSGLGASGIFKSPELLFFGRFVLEPAGVGSDMG